MSLMERPQSWNSATLESLLVHVIGGDWGKPPDHEEPGYQTVACIRGSEFRNWRNESGRTAVPRTVKANSLEKRSLVPGDILLEISGGGPDQPVGRTVLINQSVLDQFATPVIGTNFLRLLRPSAGLDQRFLNRYLEFFYSSGEVIRYQGGSNNLRNLKFKDYSQIPLPIPPLAEQKVIADKLDTLLAQADNTKARLERIPQILKRFRQSVLAAAVSGGLTEEWRSTSADKPKEPSEGKERFKSDLFDSACESLPAIPTSWLIVPAAKVLEYVTSGSRGWSRYYSDNGSLFLRMSNVRYDTTSLDLNDLQYVQLPENVEGKRSLVEKDDLIVSITADVGRVARIDNDLGEAYVNQHLALLRPTSDIHSEYFATCIAAVNVGMKQVSTFKRGATKAGLGLDDIRSLAIPFPSFKEQTEIVRRVDQLFAHADRIEQQVNNALARVNTLTQSILAKAFRGELTEQWRQDHPDLISGENSAEALLERIKAERAAAAPAKRTRKTKRRG